MTQTNHTPGPWAFRMTGWQTNPTAIYSPRRPGAVACIPARTSVPLDEQSANARLIAAAPDLLAALEAAARFIADEVEQRGLAGSDMSDYQDEAVQALERVEAAIAKAKGE